MARAESGRVVVEVDPALKRKLYSVLAMRGLTLKAWFLNEAEAFIAELDTDKDSKDTK